VYLYSKSFIETIQLLQAQKVSSELHVDSRDYLAARTRKFGGMKSDNDPSHVSDRRLCCLLGSKFGVCVIFLPVPLPVYQPPCLSFAVSSEGFVNEMSVNKHILTDHIHRVTPRITNRSSLRSLRMCRKDRRVSRRSDYGNDAQLCTSHSGHFFFGSRMSACGIHGRFHRCGVIRGSDRQQC